MREIDLITLQQVYLKEQGVDKYLGYSAKKRELGVLSNFINEVSHSTTERTLMSNFYYGYTIPQISKEFDLLRIDKEYVLNIELKEKASEEAIIKQLKQNQYYLRSLERKVFSYAYILDDNMLYKYNNDQLTIINFSTFVEEIADLKISQPRNIDIDTLFKPGKYLISVFNDTDRFLNDEYFLNDSQQRIKKELKDSVDLFKSITGEPGTGKTLLLYDIAKDYIDNDKNILIIHCGKKNYGHEKLQKNNWNITIVRDFEEFLNPELEVIFIDEAQRLYSYQFEKIVDFANDNKIEVYFSSDPEQYLHKSENEANTVNRILQLEVIARTLTKKIRTNKELNVFIKELFDAKKSHQKNFNMRDYVELIVMDNVCKANQYIEELFQNSEGEIIPLNLTEDLYTKRVYHKYSINNNVFNSHDVIGQEFNHIVLIIGDYVEYNTNGELAATCDSYYDVVKMLYQLLTRVKEKITLIVVNNDHVTTRVLNIFG